MPLRDLVAAAIVFGFLPASFRNPFIGLLVFTWLAYMRIQDLCWGFARQMRFSYIVAIVMIAGLVLNERKRPFARLDLRTALMVALVVLTLLSVLQGYKLDGHTWQRYLEFVKIVIIALVTTGLTDSKRRLDQLVLVIALSLGFFGFKGGIFVILSGGSPILRGPGGMMEDNNDFALALVMAVPMLYYLGLGQQIKWRRWAFHTAAFLNCITILLTHSRGGFLALAATLAVIGWRSKRRGTAFGLAIAGVVLFLLLTPAHVLERLSTMRTYHKDASAMGRIIAWRAAMGMVTVHPFFGVGMTSFQKAWLTNRSFWVEGVKPHAEARVAHNSYLQIWAETGTPAFLCYGLLLFSSFYVLRRMRLDSRRGRAPPWVENYARMMEASLTGFLVGAFFLNRGHFDLVYQILAIVTVIFFLVRKENRAGTRPEAAAPSSRPPPARPRPGFSGAAGGEWPLRPDPGSLYKRP